MTRVRVAAGPRRSSPDGRPHDVPEPFRTRHGMPQHAVGNGSGGLGHDGVDRGQIDGHSSGSRPGAGERRHRDRVEAAPVVDGRAFERGQDLADHLDGFTDLRRGMLERHAEPLLVDPFDLRSQAEDEAAG